MRVFSKGLVACVFIACILGAWILPMSFSYSIEPTRVSAIQQPLFPTIPILTYSSYLGGDAGEFSYNAVFDEEGNLIIVGDTGSSDFPILNAYQDSIAGMGDAFVAKFDSQNHLVFSTYFGGSNVDRGASVCVDATGNIIIVGQTSSSDFPTMNAFQPTYNGDNDGYIAKFSPTGDLLFSTFIGGSGEEWINEIMLDPTGNYICLGSTHSSNLNTTLNAIQSEYGGSFDLLLVSMSPDGQTQPLLSYFGSVGSERIVTGNFDGEGNLVLSSVVDSADNTTESAIQQIYGGGEGDILIAKLSSDLLTLTCATLLGGMDWDFGSRIGFDEDNNILVTGYTASSDFPVQNALQQVLGGQSDAFIAKLSSNCEQLVFSTFIGGEGYEQSHAGAFLNDGSIVIAGESSSLDFPLVNPMQSTLIGSHDIFIAHVEADGQSLRFSTLLGGLGEDAAEWIHIDGAGRYCLVGATTSLNYPVVNPFQTELGGYQDLCITQIITVPAPFGLGALLSPVGIGLIIIICVILIIVVIIVYYRKRK